MSAGVCQEETCTASHPTHKWGNIKAYGEGWYMMRDGREWCPDHRPEWAPALKTGTEE